MHCFCWVALLTHAGTECAKYHVPQGRCDSQLQKFQSMVPGSSVNRFELVAPQAPWQECVMRNLLISRWSGSQSREKWRWNPKLPIRAHFLWTNLRSRRFYLLKALPPSTNNRSRKQSYLSMALGGIQESNHIKIQEDRRRVFISNWSLWRCFGKTTHWNKVTWPSPLCRWSSLLRLYPHHL